VIKVKHACEACDATGLYSGFAEPKGTAVICLGCKGRGWVESHLKEFTGRKKKSGVKVIKYSRGSFIATGVGPTDDPGMTYEEFEKSIQV